MRRVFETVPREEKGGVNDHNSWHLLHHNLCHCFVECPLICYMDLDGSWLLAMFGETGWFGDLSPFSYLEDRMKNRVVPERGTFHFPL
jgi:hypothetical protein